MPLGQSVNVKLHQSFQLLISFLVQLSGYNNDTSSCSMALSEIYILYNCVIITYNILMLVKSSISISFITFLL